MSEIIEKILLILFGLFILWLLLSWMVPQFADINDAREEASDIEENENDNPDNSKYNHTNDFITAVVSNNWDSEPEYILIKIRNYINLNIG